MNRTLVACWRRLLVAALALSWTWAAQAQVTQDWAAVTPATYGDMIALDRDNNAYVAGSLPFSAMLIKKVGPTGVQLWQRVFDNPGTREQSSWVTVDAAGNAIVTGYLVAGDGVSPNGLVVLKYDPAGNLLWQDVVPSAFGYALRASTDAAGNIYVLGRAWLPNASGNTTHDIVTVKYSAAGVRQWQRNFGFDSTSADSPASMLVTPAGNVVVTGGAVGRMLMAAYDPNGNQLWSKSVAASTAALDVATGPSGELYVVGGTYSVATGNAFLVIKHDANFNELWRRTYNVGPWGWRVAVDSNGHAVVAGVAAGGYLDWMTIKLDPAGNLLWSRRYDQHRFNDEIPYFMVLGPDNAIYITGQGGPGPSSGNLSNLRTVTLKYTADGTQTWAVSSVDSVRGLGARLGSDNGVFVLGESPLTVFHLKQTGTTNQAPIAAASANKTSGPAPLAVSFSSAGSTDPDGSVVRYQWNFGDGSSSLEANPTHSYAAGSYSASLTVTDNLGGASTSAPITIAATPSAPPPPTPTSLVLASATVTGGRDTRATVTVSSAAGVLVTLSSSNTSLVTVPSSVQVPAGSTSASFRVQTSRVRTGTTVVLEATANGASRSTTLTLLPR